MWPQSDGRSSAARRAQLQAPRKKRAYEQAAKSSSAELVEQPSVLQLSPPVPSDQPLFEALFAPDALFDATQYILALSSQLPTVTEESPVALTTRPEARQRSVRLTWWRPHGPTAIVPGLKRVTIKVRLDAPPERASASFGTLLGSPLYPTDELFDERGLPAPTLRAHLLDIFAQHFECQFPALSPDVLAEAGERGNAFLLNCVAAMAARFSHNPAVARPDLKPHEYGQPFQVRAESLLASSLAVPTRETVGALVLLAHLGLSNASESHMWMYTGMAVRMALDLGLHLDTVAETEAEARLDRLAFWPVLLLDYSLSVGTGRRTTLDLGDITQRVPSAEDTPSPFPYAARQMSALGPIINLLNTGGSRDALQCATTVAVDIYRQLPPDMVWNAANFQRHQAACNAGIFLQLHLWMHAIIANDFLCEESAAPDVWRNSVRTIGDILVLSDVIDPLAYAASRTSTRRSTSPAAAI